jgi:hypothetical protein
MKIRLLREIRENMKINSLGKITDPGTLKVSVRRGMAHPFSVGAVIDMSDASAAKYIEAGVAEAAEADAALGPTFPAAASGPTLGALETLSTADVGAIPAELADAGS